MHQLAQELQNIQMEENNNRIKSSAKIDEIFHQNFIDLFLLSRQIWITAEKALQLIDIKMTIQPQKHKEQKNI